MTDQQKNLEVDTEKEAFVSDESLLPNNEMKPEKRVGTSAILYRSLCNGSVGWWLFGLLVNPYD